MFIFREISKWFATENKIDERDLTGKTEREIAWTSLKSEINKIGQFKNKTLNTSGFIKTKVMKSHK